MQISIDNIQKAYELISILELKKMNEKADYETCHILSHFISTIKNNMFKDLGKIKNFKVEYYSHLTQNTTIKEVRL